MKNRSFSQEVVYDLPVTVERIWPYLSDTNRVNRATGLGAKKFTEVKDPRGGGRRFAVEKTPFGPMPYEEKPFEWVLHQWFEVERVFSRGTITRLVGTFTAENTPGGSRHVARMTYTPVNMVTRFLSWIYFKHHMIPRMVKLMKTVATSLAQTHLPPDPFQTTKEPPAEAVAALAGKLAALTPDGELARAVSQFVLASADAELIQIRPYRLAKKLGFPRRAVLVLLLRAVREGLFDLGWSLLCPVCRGPKNTGRTLADLKAEGFCPSCHVGINAVLDETVELHVAPNPNLRAVDGQIYCSGGPAATTHVVWQRRVPPGSANDFKMPLGPGTYRLSSPQINETLLIEVGGGMASTLSLKLPSLPVGPLTLAPGEISFHLENQDPAGELLVRMERTTWLEDIVTAADAAATQEFRDLFSTEVVRPGQEIGVKSVTLLFSDLKGSTRFYNEAGDPKAFSLVNEHFDVLTEAVVACEGAVVKTIGDAIMAVFTSPEQGVAAAFKMQEGMAALNARRGGQALLLKLGLHAGPALAVTLNDRLDYFGRTVNLAARTEGLCRGGDLVLSQKLFELPGVRQLVLEKGAEVEPIRETLKGFEESTDLVRIKLAGGPLSV